MRRYERYSAQRQLTMGLLFISLGLIVLADRLYLIDFGDTIRMFWPVVLIVVGISRLLSRVSPPRLEEGRDNVR